MKTMKSTKRSLLISALSLFLCVVMLAGTTFAWFTDSVSSKNNIITSGNLDVELYWSTDAKNWDKVDEKDEIFKDETLWEPGYTEVVYLKVVNEGSLALKYQLGVNIVDEKTGINQAGESFKLSDYIEFGVEETAEAVSYDTRDAALAAIEEYQIISKGYSKSSQLYAANDAEKRATEEYATLVVTMPETVGNVANHDGTNIPFIQLGITLFATQLASEEDSFGSDYDAAAAWTGSIDTAWYDPDATELEINSPEALAGLAAIVNGTAAAPATTFAADSTATLHDDFNGKTIKLSADLNLRNIPWTPIGRTGVNTTDFTYAFRGTFDGQGHTVYNLKVASEGWAGLFGIAYKATIKNVTVDGVDLDSSRMTGAVVGQLYGSIDNCHVKNADINVVPNATASGKYDNGDKVGGIVGWIGDNGNNHTLTNCTAEKVTIKGYRDIGGIAGYVAWSTVVGNNKVTDSTLIGDQSVNFYGVKDYNVNPVWGRNSVSNSGAGVVDNGDNTSANVTVNTVNVIADAAGLKAALANGGEYKVAQDFAVEEANTIKNGVSVVLDLNGKTITGTDNMTGSFGLITNKGDLTITGNGKITLVATNNRGWNAYSSVISNTVGGKLTVEGGTIEHLGGTDMAYGIDNLTNGKGTYAETIINGGIIKSPYRAIRMFLNGVEADNILTVNGGTIEGANKSIWMQDPSKNANTGKLTVSADAVLNGNVYLYVTPGSTEWPVEVAIADAALAKESKVISGNVPEGYAVGKNNDTWVVKAGEIVSNVTDLQAALDAAAAGETTKIILGADVSGELTVTQKGDTKVVIDGNGNTFTGALIVDGKSATITSAGLTIQNMVFKADSITEDACINLGKEGDNNTRYTCNVTISNCTFDVPGAVGVKSYTGGDKNLTIVNCTATANAHSLVQIAGVDGVLIENCEINSKNGINVNQSDNVVISGCTANVKGYAVRFGAGSGDTGAAETYLIKNCTLKSACDDGDAVIILRGTADYATLTIENTTLEGTIEITNTATDATVVK